MTQTLTSGSLLLALLIALLAGAMSFASPCVLPLVPSYLGYVVSSVGASPQRRARRTTVRGAAMFVLGFSLVFLAYGAIFGAAGNSLAAHRELLERILGVVVVLLGIAFMGGISWLQADRRPHSWSATGLGGAVILGFAFGLGWSPCIGPALAAVQALAFAQATAVRGTILSAAYCVGLGLPFLLLALVGSRATGSLAFLRRHIRTLNVLGGVMLVVLGICLVTGLWADVIAWVQARVPGWTPPW